MQIVIALIVTPEGFPLAYEVLPGNTTNKTTLQDFLAKIEKQYGQTQRIWVMNRGIPIEETLAQMRASNPPVSYLVGTPKGKLTAFEAELATRDWRQARPSGRAKLLPQAGETCVLVQSQDRIAKERAMRRRRLRAYLDRLAEIKTRKRPLRRDALHQAQGAAKKDAGRDELFVQVDMQFHGESKVQHATLSWKLDPKTLRTAWRREGRYLLRANLAESDPAKLWEFYLQLNEVEQSFKELKGALALRPIHHQLEGRIKAHLFLAYCLQVTLKARLRRTASGLTPRAVLEKFAAVQIIDVHLPTTDGREMVVARHTQPEKDLQLLPDQLKLQLELPNQGPPKIQALK